MEESDNGKNKITILEDLRTQNSMTGFDIKIEDVEYYYADGEIDIVNGITVNKGYIKGNPSYINNNYAVCPTVDAGKLPTEIYQTKAGMCNNEGEGCYNRNSLLLSYYFDAYNTPIVYFYAYANQQYQNNKPYKLVSSSPYGVEPYNSLPSAKYLLYKVEKVDNGDGTYDYKVEDLRTDDMTGFYYKIIKDVENNLSYANGACNITKQDYIIIEKGIINNYNLLDSDGCYYYMDYTSSNDFPYSVTNQTLYNCSESNGENCYKGSQLYLSNLDYSNEYLKTMWVYAYNGGASKTVTQSYGSAEPTYDYVAANLWKVNITENGEYNITDIRDSSKVSGFNQKLICTKQYNSENQLIKTYYLNIEKGIVK